MTAEVQVDKVHVVLGGVDLVRGDLEVGGAVAGLKRLEFWEMIKMGWIEERKKKWIFTLALF